MLARLRSWWQKTSKPRLVLIVTLLVVLLVLLIGGYFFNWTWTGFGPYTLPSSNFQREKTLYDWLQLAIIPVALAVGVWWLNRLQQERDQNLANQRTQTE
jgi:flagellar basal body-associated protein FliL